jgi:hypothetical protein
MLQGPPDRIRLNITQDSFDDAILNGNQHTPSFYRLAAPRSQLGRNSFQLIDFTLDARLSAVRNVVQWAGGAIQPEAIRRNLICSANSRGWLANKRPAGLNMVRKWFTVFR